jgi:hypothetical protein
MPRQKSIVTIIRDLVRTEIQKALSSLFGGLGVGGAGARRGRTAKAKPKNGRRRRRKTTARAAATTGAKRGRPTTRRRRRAGAAGES